MRHCFYCFILFSFVIPHATQGQSVSQTRGETGTSFIRNISPQTYGAHNQVWDIAQDDRGLMYFATNPGPVEYDGVSWRVIETANSSFALSIAKHNSGTIYVGAIDEIGYLAPDSVGVMRYVSLVHHLPEDEQKMGIVWRTLTNNDGVYFQAFSKIMHWAPGENPGEGAMHILKPDEGNRFSLSSMVNGRLYVQELKKGMLVLEGDSLMLLPGGEAFAEENMPVMLPYRSDQLLAVSMRKGLFVYDGTSFERFPTEADSYFIEQLKQPSHGILLPDSTYAFTFVRGGMITMDQTGRLLQTIEETEGLQTLNVKKAFLDDQQGLWLGLNEGIARVENHVSVYDAA